MKLYKLERAEAKTKIQSRLLGIEFGLRIFNYYISLFIYDKYSQKRGKIVGIEFQRQGSLITIITKLKERRINVISYINIYKVI